MAGSSGHYWKRQGGKHGTADFCTGSSAAGCDGSEGEAMVESVHRIVEIFKGKRPKFIILRFWFTEDGLGDFLILLIC